MSKVSAVSGRSVGANLRAPDVVFLDVLRCFLLHLDKVLEKIYEPKIDHFTAENTSIIEINMLPQQVKKC